MNKQLFLVFDTATVVRKIATIIVTELGFMVAETANYEEAVDICRRTMPDFILVDGMLEGDLTHKFISYVRTLPDGGKPHIIFTPLEQDAGKLTKILRAGADDYLLRPFEADQLRAKVKVGGQPHPQPSQPSVQHSKNVLLAAF
jgi:two-component system, chemotaxis family, chemotaxis protein CheY